MSRPALAALGAALVVTLGGCQSSQDQSARLQRQGAHAISSQKGLVVATTNTDVGIMQTGVVSDSNGAAAVIVLRSRKPTAIGSVPIAIDVLGKTGKSVFKNNAPGLEASLTSVPSLAPRGQLSWVDDQITASDKPAGVRARIGAGGSGAPAELPRIEVTQPTLQTDPVSGLEATGKVTNRSSVLQQRLMVYVVGWRGKQIVAAGRGVIDRLTPGGHANYHVFLIGNPNGARLTVAAPPTILR
jgi:hypothetical protein